VCDTRSEPRLGKEAVFDNPQKPLPHGRGSDARFSSHTLQGTDLMKCIAPLYGQCSAVAPRLLRMVTISATLIVPSMFESQWKFSAVTG
jgi:hypothetical protein